MIPDPGIRFQLVHEDDVASAFAAAVRGLGEPGPYNLAGSGLLTMSSIADALGWYSVPVPKPLVDATAEIATRLPLMPEQVAWIHSVKKPVLMKTDRAKKQLRWRPKHTARATLKEMADATQQLPADRAPKVASPGERIAISVPVALLLLITFSVFVYFCSRRR